ncbi:MAG: hypothetical protein ABSA72_10855 [Nitrososphaerales archaeon]
MTSLVGPRPGSTKITASLAVTAVLLVVLLVAPIVTYSIPLNPVAFNLLQSHCIPSQPQVTCANLSEFYPDPTTLTARASLSYALLGVGGPPFPGYYTMANGNYSTSGGRGTDVFFLKGTSVTGAEYLPYPSVEVDPSGVVAIRNVSLVRGPLGIVNFTATVQNIGTQAISGAQVVFGVPGNGDNFTYMGVNWIQLPTFGQLLNVVGCPDSVAPGAECVASFQAISETLSPGQTFGYTIQVTGAVGGVGLLYNQWFQGVWPTREATPSWVSNFIQQVNLDRTGPKLTENSTLDAFAKERFQTQVANSSISNYGFQQDYAKSFPGSGPQIGEDTLWTGTDTPLEYITFLQQSAPGHWSVLTNPDFTQFGFYIGYGPSIFVSQPCSITEFPGNVNMTALLASNGCQFHIEQAVWLVIEVGS